MGTIRCSRLRATAPVANRLGLMRNETAPPCVMAAKDESWRGLNRSGFEAPHSNITALGVTLEPRSYFIDDTESLVERTDAQSASGSIEQSGSRGSGEIQ